MPRARERTPEVSGAELLFTHPLRQYVEEKYPYVQIVEIRPKRNKEDRAKALIPYYKQGRVFHNRRTCAPLEKQLLAYPMPHKWDVLDAAAHVLVIMDKANIYHANRIPGQSMEDVFASYQPDLPPLEDDDRWSFEGHSLQGVM